MRSIRLALAQLNPTVGDLEGNFQRVVESIEQARRLAVDVLAFPEMMITGYMPEDLLLKPSFIDRAIERTHALEPFTTGMTVIVGTVERDLQLFTSAAILHDGRWGGSYRKRYLPNYGVFDENRYFMAARTSPVFSRGGTVLGISICEDIWYPGGPVEEQVIRGGAEILINLSASPYHAGKAQSRKRMLCTRAADNLAVIAYVNLVGGQDEVLFDGASLILDEQGQVLAEGEMFEEDFVVADVELDAVFNARLHDPRLRKERALDDGDPVPRLELAPADDERAAGAGARTRGAVAVATRPALDRRLTPIVRELPAEIYDALVLGTRDYVHKNDFGTVVLGLSGGIDSALCACIACDAVGPRKVVGASMPSQFTS